MNITESAELTELRGMLRKLLAPLGGSVAAEAARRGELWDALTSEIGLLDAVVDPAVLDGAGEAMMMTVVAEEVGRALAPVPLAPTMLALAVLKQCGDSGEALISWLVAERGVAAVAVADLIESGTPVMTAVEAGGWKLTGTAPLVASADNADLVIVPAMQGDEVLLFGVMRASEGVTSGAAPVLDGTREFADLTLDAAPGQLLAGAGEAPRVIQAAIDLGALLLAADSLGGARRCLEMTLEYVRQREQFGRSIGSYQAVKHRLADHFVAIEATASLVALAAAIADDPNARAEQFRIAASAAKAHAAGTYTAVAGDTIQLHGAIGYTWEHRAHLYFKRAHVSARYWGGVESHRERIAGSVGL